MSSGLYSHTTRATGTVLTAQIYNDDHQNHINNHRPSMIGGYSDTVAEMQTATNPGGIGTESLPASLAGELERIRYAIDRIVGKSQWYEAPDRSLSDNPAEFGEIKIDSFSSTGASTGARLEGQLRDSSTTATTNIAHNRFHNPNGTVGQIITSGSTTTYNTSSDGKHKSAVSNVNRASMIGKIKSGRPVEFEFKTEPGAKHLGFIAQEMYDICPDAVTPGEGEIPWMMDHSKLVPILWAAVADLVSRIETLEQQ